jgi:hypothetical protein
MMMIQLHFIFNVLENKHLRKTIESRHSRRDKSVAWYKDTGHVKKMTHDPLKV